MSPHPKAKREPLRTFINVAVALIFLLVCVMVSRDVFSWLVGSSAAAAYPGKAEERSTVWLQAVVDGPPTVRVDEAGGETFYMNVIWQIAPVPGGERVMSHASSHVQLSRSDPRIRELSEGMTVFVLVPANMVSVTDKYAHYLGYGDDAPVLAEFLLYREFPFLKLP